MTSNWYIDTFSKVRDHLLSQNRRSYNRGGCAYRSEEGLRCAIGCLLLDHEIPPDNIAVCDISRDVVNRLVDRQIEDYEWKRRVSFLMELQKIHDTDEPIDWKGLLVLKKVLEIATRDLT